MPSLDGCQKKEEGLSRREDEEEEEGNLSTTAALRLLTASTKYRVKLLAGLN